ETLINMTSPNAYPAGPPVMAGYNPALAPQASGNWFVEHPKISAALGGLAAIGLAYGVTNATTVNNGNIARIHSNPIASALDMTPAQSADKCADPSDTGDMTFDNGRPNLNIEAGKSLTGDGLV